MLVFGSVLQTEYFPRTKTLIDEGNIPNAGPRGCLPHPHWSPVFLSRPLCVEGGSTRAEAVWNAISRRGPV